MAPEVGSPADRAYGALLGQAIGDALGMPTQGLSREQIASRWGVLDRFVAAPADNPISHGMPAGRVTDDTDQALILGRLLVAGGGRIDSHAWAEALLQWQQEMADRGSFDLLGPSTLRALAALQSGASIDDAGREGDTNGAAMRIAPIGIATRLEPLSELVDAVVAASRLTHNTGIAISGAAAIAAAVSAAIEGLPWSMVAQHAAAAARVGAKRGAYAAGARVADRIEWAMTMATGTGSHERVLDVVDRLVGTSLATQESVPAAFAMVATFPHDAWDACRHAASVGGDCDTIAAMAGAIAGSMHGAAAFPRSVVQEVLSANPGLELETISGDLLTLRLRAGAGE